jgi:predicted nucleic acid-binding protein
MKDKLFFDTNIFVYAYDDRDLRKHRIATDLIREFTATKNVVISYQVVQEFFNVALGKSARKLTHEDARKVLDDLFRPLKIVSPSFALVSEGIHIQQRYKLSWYDSLIVSAAQYAGCDLLYSEDLQHGQQFGAVTVHDPFR